MFWLVAIGLAVAACSRRLPPFAEPVDGQAVYDFAEILSADTEQYAEQIADAVEAQTAAEVIVYTQVGGAGSDPGGRGRPP